MLGEGETRKSARIAAIEALKREKRKRGETFNPNDIYASSVSRQTGRRKGSKRKSLAEVDRTSLSLTAQKVGEEEKNEHYSIRSGDLNVVHPLPAKRYLVKALDILQRRDSENLFGHSVNTEVENYDEAIDEPMDFGTLRSKLQAQVYLTFEEFEYDVLLIFENAMFLNGETTLHYKHGRALFELSKRVLQTLKTDPEKLEQLEHDLSQEPMGLALGRRDNEGRSYTNKDARLGTPQAYHFLSSNQLSDHDGEKDNSGSARDSYRPSELAVSEIFDGTKTLVPGNGFGFGYRNSLMQFVKNLGPVAQRVAARKLSPLVPNLQPATSSHLQETNWLSSSLSASRKFFPPGLQGRNLTDEGRNVIMDMDSPASNEETIQPADRQFLREFMNEVRSMDAISQQHQTGLNQIGAYNLSESRTLGSSHLHNHVLQNQLSLGSGSSFYGAMARNVRRTTKVSVYPTTYLRPTRFGRTNNSLHGLGGSSSQSGKSSNYGYEGRLPEVNHVKPSNPRRVFQPQQGQQMGPFLRLLIMGEDTFDQEAQSSNPTELCGPRESISIGLGPDRFFYPQRFGVNLPGMNQQSQSQGPSQVVYGQWRSILPPKGPPELQRQLMPPPGERSNRPPPSGDYRQ